MKNYMDLNKIYLSLLGGFSVLVLTAVVSSPVHALVVQVVNSIPAPETGAYYGPGYPVGVSGAYGYHGGDLGGYGYHRGGAAYGYRGGVGHVGGAGHYGRAGHVGGVGHYGRAGHVGGVGHHAGGAGRGRR